MLHHIDASVQHMTLLECGAERAVQAVLEIQLAFPLDDVREEVSEEGRVLVEEGGQVERVLGRDQLVEADLMRGDLCPVADSQTVVWIWPRITNPLENHPAECSDAVPVQPALTRASVGRDANAAKRAYRTALGALSWVRQGESEAEYGYDPRRLRPTLVCMSETQVVEIRRLRPHEAGDVVDAVFAGLSNESRRLRFHLPITRLPAYVREELVRLDGCTRAAVAASVDGRPVGIGRIAAVSATEVETAIAVVDSSQGRGIGRQLLRASAELAADLGYRQLTAEVLAENAGMLKVLASVFPEARRERAGNVLRIVVDLDDATADVREPVLAAAS
jgi:GNAT superfamily N-acetyltransferase